MVETYNLPPLPATYYMSAIAAYKGKYKHPVFVMVSDASDWGKKHLLPKVGKRAVVVPVEHFANVDHRDEVKKPFCGWKNGLLYYVQIEVTILNCYFFVPKQLTPVTCKMTSVL